MKKNSKIEKTTMVLRKTKIVLVVMAVVMSMMTNTVLAADPLATINSLSTFIFSAIKANEVRKVPINEESTEQKIQQNSLKIWRGNLART